MKKIELIIRLNSEWQVGSGLSGGISSDALALKDKEGFPYIPGKTIKGLILEGLKSAQELGHVETSEIDILMGSGADQKGIQAITFFSNAYLSESTRAQINAEDRKKLFRNISNTQIGKDGIAVDKSLRTTEVCMPLTLRAEILIEPTDELDSERAKELLDDAIKWVKFLGIKRTRGLGRCDFLIK